MINNTTEREIMESLMDRESRRLTNTEVNLPQPTHSYPDAKKHQKISFIKSGVRIVGYILIPFNLVAAAGVLILSEFIGIYEELV
tara:strand:- start:273 stop:527 length:255 start_codon:yes stop_codon:yes gene_type:complete